MLAYGRRVLDAAAELGSELGGRISEPRGWVHVSVSLVIAEAVIAPSLDGLYRRYPNLHVELRADDRFADMARDGITLPSVPANSRVKRWLRGGSGDTAGRWSPRRPTSGASGRRERWPSSTRIA